MIINKSQTQAQTQAWDYMLTEDLSWVGKYYKPQTQLSLFWSINVSIKRHIQNMIIERKKIMNMLS